MSIAKKIKNTPKMCLIFVMVEVRGVNPLRLKVNP